MHKIKNKPGIIAESWIKKTGIKPVNFNVIVMLNQTGNNKINRNIILISITNLFFVLTGISQNGCGYEIAPDNCRPSIISKETNMWYFGKGAGLDFNTIPAHAIQCPKINQLEGGATISDKSGNFLFAVNFPVSSYGQKMDLLNENFVEIKNSEDLGGHYSASQNSLIVPQPGKAGVYFVFTVGIPLPEPYGKGLAYSILDMEAPDPVISKNNILIAPATEKITAVKHANGTDVWVIGHEWNSDRFFASLLTQYGLEEPVISTAGTFHAKDDFNNNAIGYIKASPDGCKIAVAIYGMGIIELLDFNKSTGKIYNPITSNPDYTGAYGIDFSPDSRFLYLSTNDYCYNTDFESKLYQFCIDDGTDLFINPVEIATNTSIDYLGLQLAADGKIYIAQSMREQLPVGGYGYVGVLHNPTRKTACNFNRLDHQTNDGIFLEGGLCRIGLPNFVQSYLYMPKFTYRYNCLKDETRFALVNKTNVDSVRWNFGDGTFSMEFEPLHQYASPGSYNVKVTDYFENTGYIDSLVININPLPPVKINGGADTVILLPESYVTLDAGSNYQTYDWNTGQTTQRIDATTEGYYRVEVSNDYCCTEIDSIFVELINIVVPNAFLPSVGGPDKYFRIIDQENVIVSFSIFIYNRFGQLVYESKSKYFQWDGSDLGTDIFYYSFEATLTDGFVYRKNGNVTLLR